MGLDEGLELGALLVLGALVGLEVGIVVVGEIVGLLELITVVPHGPAIRTSSMVVSSIPSLSWSMENAQQPV